MASDPVIEFQGVLKTSPKAGVRRLGKWSQPGVPHKGWSCVDVWDAGDTTPLCEMCEAQEIRYVHLMRHPEYKSDLHVGCVCAGKMEEDYEGAKRREQVLKSRTRWIVGGWKTSDKGNEYRKSGDFRFVVFQRGDHWAGLIENTTDGSKRFSKEKYATPAEVKLAMFEAVRIAA